MMAKALEKLYNCPYCNEVYAHKDARKHWETLCPMRSGSTVKPPKGQEVPCGT